MNRDPQKATLQQVAQSAGVSLKTASRVLNHEPHVKPDKEAAVRSAMELLCYQPNELARSLVARRSGVIGVVVPYLSHSFLSACVEAIHHAAEDVGLTIMVTVSDGDPEAETVQIRTLLRRQVEGLIVFPAVRSPYSQNASELAGTPVVFVDQPSAAPKMDSILVANREAARKVVDHLIGHGYRRIAVLGTNRHLHTISERIAGYEEAMRSAGLKMVERVPRRGEQLSIAVMQKLFALAAKAPRAVFTLNSTTSIKALHALKLCHLRVPEDVALFGFDDFDTADSFEPSISVVRQPTEEIGKHAVELIFKRIRQQRHRAGQKIILATEILIRDSCGCHENLS